MYGFVEVNEAGTQSTPMSIQTVFNDFNLDEELTDETGSFMTLTVTGRSNVSNDIKTMNIPGLDGVIERSDITLKDKPIEVKYKIKDDTNAGLRDRYNKLNGLLEGSKMELVFTDKNLLYYATLQDNDVPEEDSNELVGTITFFCSDPFAYGPPQTHKFTSDIAIINNKGTAKSDPVFTLTALQKSTFAMVQNMNQEYMLIGRPADVDVQKVNEKDLLFREYGEHLDDWTTSGTQADNTKITGGQLGYDGTGIHPLSYGSPGDYDGWYGPALMKEITPTQDFEVNMHIRVDTDKPSELYRIEAYLYDEHKNVLGKIAVRDFSLSTDRFAAEGRVGEFLGAGKNYLISKDNYLKNEDHFHGMVRMRRKGKTITFYVSKLKTGSGGQGKHYDTLKVDYHDLDSKYQGKLKYIQINITRNTNGPSANVPRIDRIEAYKLNKVTQDKTPYILYEGDVVEFDHENKDIRINGESRKDLKDFGGSFFKLKKGDNQLLVSPINTFDTKVKYKERYR